MRRRGRADHEGRERGRPLPRAARARPRHPRPVCAARGGDPAAPPLPARLHRATLAAPARHRGARPPARPRGAARRAPPRNRPPRRGPCAERPALAIPARRSPRSETMNERGSGRPGAPPAHARRPARSAAMNEGEAPDQLPVACTLTTAEMRERRRLVLEPLAAAVLEVAPLAGGLALRFAASGATLAGLAALIDLERRCCPFLRFALTVE